MTERLVKPMPDLDTVDYWQALADGRLTAARCRDCGAWSWPPRPICSKCHGGDLALEDVAGTGEVYSWIVVHRHTTPDMMRHVPYTLALVRLDEQADIYIPARLTGVDNHAVRRGLRVRAAPERIDEKLGDLVWEAAP